MTDKAKANLTRLLQSHSRQSRELGRALLKSSELSEEEQMEIDPDYLKIGDIWFHFICDPFIEEQARLNPFNPGPPR